MIPTRKRCRFQQTDIKDYVSFGSPDSKDRMERFASGTDSRGQRYEGEQEDLDTNFSKNSSSFKEEDIEQMEAMQRIAH